jgi:hypothetical protein
VFRDRHYFQRKENLCVTDLQRRIKIEFVQEKKIFFYKIKSNKIRKQVQFQNISIFFDDHRCEIVSKGGEVLKYLYSNVE